MISEKAIPAMKTATERTLRLRFQMGACDFDIKIKLPYLVR